MPNKFEHFDYNGNGTIVRLQDALTSDGSDLRTEYDRRQLFCPFCHVARLTFVSKSTDMHGRVRKAHLVTKRPSQNDPNNHADGCKGIVEHEATETEVGFYTDLSNEQIKSKLDADIRRFLRSTSPDGDIEPIEGGGSRATTKGGVRKVKHRRNPVKSIYKIREVDDTNIISPTHLRGKVLLWAEEKPSKYGGLPFYILHVYDVNTKEELWRFYRDNIKDDVSVGVPYYVSMIVRYERSDRGGLRCYLLTPQAIRIIQL